MRSYNEIEKPEGSKGLNRKARPYNRIAYLVPIGKDACWKRSERIFGDCEIRVRANRLSSPDVTIEWFNCAEAQSDNWHGRNAHVSS